MTSAFSDASANERPPNRIIFRLVLLILTAALCLAALLLPISIRPSSLPLKPGDVAPVDIRAPHDLTYTSSVLTQQARDAAAAAVLPVYLPADPAIARRQIERLRAALVYITTVREDAYATKQQKLSDLIALQDVSLSPETETGILTLTDAQWEAVQQEALNVLEQVMRNTIRDSQIDEVKHSIPTLISFSMPQDQASIVADLVSGFVVPNSLYSPSLTAAAQAKAREAVQPVTRSYIANETIVLRGQIITPVVWEALDKFGLVQPGDNRSEIAATFALVAILSLFSALYFARRKSAPFNDFRSLALIAFTFVIFLFAARLIIPNRTIIPYLYPLAAFGLTIASLFNLEIGLVLSLVLSILAAYGLPNSLDLTLFYALSSLCGVLALGPARRVAHFIWAGLVVGLAGIAVVLAYRLTDSTTDWLGIATLIGSSVFNGIASASLALLLQFFFAQLLSLTTPLQLMELSRPDHPLLQFLLRNAPGTYQHTLQVANLAEQAAERIGADPLLTRVGAIYHDAGKALNPQFFIENQVSPHLNPHDDLDPVISAATIIQHVPDGLALARKYRLPKRLQDFIREHHGTMLTRYQYAHALELAGGDADKVDESLFRYPGPRPQSRETALIMLADGVEARARAETPENEAQLRELIKSAFDYCLREGQLDDTRLTLRDLTTAAESFVATLRNIYHPRIPYPQLKSRSTTPALEAEKTRPVNAAPADSPPASSETE
jgi:putative nucleotidyltransferase with HDIG domain